MEVEQVFLTAHSSLRLFCYPSVSPHCQDYSTLITLPSYSHIHHLISPNMYRYLSSTLLKFYCRHLFSIWSKYTLFPPLLLSLLPQNIGLAGSNIEGSHLKLKITLYVHLIFEPHLEVSLEPKPINMIPSLNIYMLLEGVFMEIFTKYDSETTPITLVHTITHLHVLILSARLRLHFYLSIVYFITRFS